MNESSFPKEIRGYRPIGLCGQGAYGQVWLVQDFANRWLALKIIYKRALGGDWQREYNGLVTYKQRIRNHPNLINIFHIEDRDTFFYYTMECADNFGDENEYIPSTLENWIHRFGKIGPESIKNIFDQLLDGVEELHQAGLIHRDIKPDNIIFVNHVPKLSDIGLITSMTHSISLVGTQPYLPPEVLLGNSESKNSFGVDLYALGKSIYRAFSGNDPNEFPKVDGEILSEKKYRKLNTFVKTACNPSTFARFDSIDSFRHVLLNGITFKNIILSFLSYILSPVESILKYPLNIFKVVWMKQRIRNFAIFLAVLISFYFLGVYKVIYIKYLNFMRYNALNVDQYQKYSSKLSNLRGNRKKEYTENQKKLMELKADSNFDGFKAAKEVETPRKYSLIYREKFENFNNWYFKRKNKVALGKKSIIVADGGSCDMKLKSVLLPEDYDINFTVSSENKISYIRFTIYNPKDLDIDHPTDPSSYIWGIGNKGAFQPLKIRPFAGCSNFSEIIRPYESICPNISNICFRIIKKGKLLRIYLNNQLLYKPTILGFSFTVGCFRIRMDSELELKKLTIHDITPKGSFNIFGKSFKDPDFQ